MSGFPPRPLQRQRVLFLKQENKYKRLFQCPKSSIDSRIIYLVRNRKIIEIFRSILGMAIN